MRGITILLIALFVITLSIMISDCGADNPPDENSVKKSQK
jgi:hypothetical protein